MSSDQGTGRRLARSKRPMPSTVIRSARYDPDREVLDIIFTTGRRYLYHGVPAATADAFRAAFSKGRHFNAYIRDRYECTEVPA